MPTNVRKSAAQDEALENEYKQWQKVHTKMKETPPADGRDYLKHANNLLALLEGVSELHPIAKAVVVSFKTAVMFEQDRRENDARVTAVFLAQTDMMRVLLDVDDLSTRRQNRWPDAENVRTTAKLGLILANMEKEIKSCGNSIDTYYKESRFVKFWKAQDWKKRMLGHIAEFTEFRVQLQTTLQVQVAVGVEDLVLKMDVVLTHFFTPKADWEKNLDKKTRSLGPPSAWINDPAILQSLISETKDPAFSFAPAAGSSGDKGKDVDKPAEGSKVKDTEKAKIDFAIDAQLAKIKKELELSLDILCERNKDMFEVKLSFHTKQLEQSIANSAQLVIKSLSGPYDRLVHEDLRHLWKEMASLFNWIFCVENKFFVSAVFEFYLDRFSGKKHVDKPDGEQHQEDSDTEEKQIVKYGSAPKFSFLSRLGSINHPDSWTLEYIAAYGENITQAIDNDNSGFIRISEANAFSQAIPKGWNLPQWCAYCAAGWAYENRIYRTRINKILSTLTEMQAKVLGTNRGYLVDYTTFFFDTICHAFAREPVGQRTPSTTQELRELVKQKVFEQDEIYRGHLQSLKWTLEDEATIHLIYGKKEPEKYILQLCTLVLEQTLALARKCTTVTVDIREWARLSTTFQLLRKITANHINELKARFEDTSSEAFNSYYGGMWTYFSVYVPYSFEELLDAYSELSIHDDFPMSKITAESAYLQYPPWEEHVKTLDRHAIPPLIPRAWDPSYESLFQGGTVIDATNRRREKSDIRVSVQCVGILVCEFPILDRFSEIERKLGGFDFCDSCHILPPEQHNVKTHNYRHVAALHALQYSSIQNERFSLEAEIIFEQLAQEFSAQDRYEYSENARDSTALNEEDDEDDLLDKAAGEFDGEPSDNGDDGDSDMEGAPTKRKYTPPVRVTLKCARCDEDINVASEFFRCIGHSCMNMYFCRDCAMNYPREDLPEGVTHEWWHSLLCLRKDLILGHWDVPVMTDHTTEATHVSLSSEDAVHLRIGILEEKLDIIQHSNASLDQRVIGLEAKLDAVIAGLEKLIGGKLPIAAPAAGAVSTNQLPVGSPANAAVVPSRELQAPASREIGAPASRQIQAPGSRAVPNYTQEIAPTQGPGLLQQIRDHTYPGGEEEEEQSEHQREQRGYDPEDQEQDEPEHQQSYGSQTRVQQHGYDEGEGEEDEPQQYHGYGSQGRVQQQQQYGGYQQQPSYDDEPEDQNEQEQGSGYGYGYNARSQQRGGYGDDEGGDDDDDFGNAADEYARQTGGGQGGYYRDY
ncbi:hypothetical protein JR316_0006274 [Psilocybe cubensis]|uniref:EF-hand domain-containing protein n=2 Tax=Psilocybe cubensis TaxID=181762 RepID=A0A8H7Y0U7_PSICU|nr:hypothetical protein JR316_0006274 [Psilocybe cubensis]KAH9481747.1 hypothetical protein JR316_0006274 [Psilocybe cubensis]